MEDAREKWNRRWKEQSSEDLTPDPWLISVSALLPEGKALDLACGRGRNALELARRGYQVTAVDISAEGLGQLQRAARDEGLAMSCRQLDLEAPLPKFPNCFEVTLCFFFLHRPLLEWLKGSVCPGGVAVLRTFSQAGHWPPPQLNPRFVLKPSELLSIFFGWDILHHEEGIEPSRKGGSLAGIVARKPVS